MWWLLLVLSAPPRTAAVKLLRDWALPTVVQKGDKVDPEPDLSTISTMLAPGGPAVQLPAGGGGATVQSQVVTPPPCGLLNTDCGVQVPGQRGVLPPHPGRAARHHRTARPALHWPAVPPAGVRHAGTGRAGLLHSLPHRAEQRGQPHQRRLPLRGNHSLHSTDCCTTAKVSAGPPRFSTASRSTQLQVVGECESARHCPALYCRPAHHPAPHIRPASGLQSGRHAQPHLRGTLHLE